LEMVKRRRKAEPSWKDRLEIRVTRLTITPINAELFHERAIHVSIVDEAGGEFVEVTQNDSMSPGTIRLDADEWPSLREAIDRMVDKCRDSLNGP